MPRFPFKPNGGAKSSTTIAYDVTDSAIDDVTESDFMQVATIPIYAIGILLSTASLYVVIALIVHRVRIKNAEQKQDRPNGGSVKKNKANTSPWLNNLSLSAAIFAFLNCMSDHPTIYTRQTSDLVCKIMQCFSFLFYSAGIASLYSFLWVRQRACYKSPTLNKIHNKVARVASSVILPLFLVMMVAGIMLTAALWTFQSSEAGCVEVSGSHTPLAVLYTGSVAMQITLLILFVYPLKRHATFQRSTTMPSDKMLVDLVKRSMITTALCVLADTVAFILAMTLDHNIPFIVINYIYDANLLCNVICVIGSFADWKRRIVPFCTRNTRPCDGARVHTLKYSTSVKTSSTTV